MPSRNLWSGLNSLRGYVVSPGEDERDRKTDQQKHDDKTQRPVRQFPCRNNRRTNLNDESRCDDISGRTAITFPPLQLLKETAHNEISARRRHYSNPYALHMEMRSLMRSLLVTKPD